ncbi:MAG: hypothetical protein HY231_13870 [Acidobacteria bacterium]|nr:hypothetical protein [Acidobacteriota bacterium]
MTIKEQQHIEAVRDLAVLKLEDLKGQPGVGQRREELRNIFEHAQALLECADRLARAQSQIAGFVAELDTIETRIGEVEAQQQENEAALSQGITDRNVEVITSCSAQQSAYQMVLKSLAIRRDELSQEIQTRDISPYQGDFNQRLFRFQQLDLAAVDENAWQEKVYNSQSAVLDRAAQHCAQIIEAQRRQVTPPEAGTVQPFYTRSEEHIVTSGDGSSEVYPKRIGRRF